MGDTVQNECNVITIFPMVIECMGINPSTPTASDGQMSVSITGGTPPYTIIWSNGNVSPAINNLSVGEYSVTVIDYYGDFTKAKNEIYTEMISYFNNYNENHIERLINNSHPPI